MGLDKLYSAVCPRCNAQACVGVTPTSVWCKNHQCTFYDGFSPPKHGDIVTVELSDDKTLRNSETAKMGGFKVRLLSAFISIVEVQSANATLQDHRKYVFLPEEIVELKPLLEWSMEMGMWTIPNQFQFTAPFGNF